MKQVEQQNNTASLTKNSKMTEKELEEFASRDLYKLAGKYAATNPIIGVDIEDYIQELVCDFWAHRNDYDPNRAKKISTFCYTRFRAVKWDLQQKAYRDINCVSLDSLIDEDGHTLHDFIADNQEDIVIGATITALLERVHPATQMYLYDFPKNKICAKFKLSPERLNKIIKEDMETLRKLCIEEGIVNAN